MSFETLDIDWSLDYCLACDKQTDGGVYCSETCRLAEYEQATSGSEASSPAAHGPGSWPTTKLTNPRWTALFEDDAPYSRKISSPRPQHQYGGTPPSKLSEAFLLRPSSSPVLQPKSSLTPSASHSSLFSMLSASSSTTSMNEQPQLSEEARKELRAYANFFDQSRYRRRQSTH